MKKKVLSVLLMLSLSAFLPGASVAAAPVSDTPLEASRDASSDYTLDYTLVFDADYYYHAYPDLQKNIGNDPAALLNHFITTGMGEGRNGNAAFQLKAYLYHNLDLLPVYGAKDLSSYYIHYITCGKAEGRKAVFEEGTAYPEGTLASFSTSYDTTQDRAINVELAAQRVNGTLLKPGETFSFDKAAGTRTLENGYVVAPSFAGGKVVTSVGGGICQVSSNLYVTMLLSGIPATRHYFHSLPVDYVPKGLDAAIVEGYKDLRFTNPFDYTISIQAVAENGTLTVSLLRE